MTQLSLNNLFPLGIAEGEAFCNRITERSHLLANIHANRHTLLISPRRYGKTSVALQTIHEGKLPFGKADFLTATDEYSVNRIILDAVAQAVVRIIPLHQKTLNKVTEWLASFSPKIIFSEDKLQLELTPIQKPQAQKNIIEALDTLDKLAIKENKRVVLLFDEFQQLASLKDNHILEASIRHVAQATKHSTYIFSGSNRHLLAEMFDDSNRPLYHLCDRMTLTRIAENDYQKFIQAAAKQKWNKFLDEFVLDEILFLTKRHPYYVNVLCSKLWMQVKPPTLEETKITWNTYVMEEQYRIANDLAPLSPNQRAILIALALNPTSEPTSSVFLTAIRLPATSTSLAIKTLMEKDLLYRNEENLLCLLDPAMETFIRIQFKKNI